jgi:serine/threonine-protein kinase RsbW
MGSPVPGQGVPAPRGVRFSVDDLRLVRRETARWAVQAGMPAGQADDFVIAVNEIATNAVRYGSPEARLLLRVAGGTAAEAEVRDGGTWEPAAGAASGDGRRGGMGLPLTRQVCDEVEIAAGRGGTTVILRMSLQPRRRVGGPR